MNDANEVIGVATGGLDGGAASISFAVPVTQIALLLSAGDTTPPSQHEGEIVAGFHSAERELIESGPNISCPGFSIQKIRTVTLAAASRNTDDAATLANILGMWNGGPSLNNERFDVYVDGTTGATFVVPQSFSIHVSGFFCEARPAGGAGTISIRIAELVAANNDPARGSYLRSFQSACQPGGSWNAQSSPDFTRADGLVVRTTRYGRSQGGALSDLSFVRSMQLDALYAASCQLSLNWFTNSNAMSACNGLGTNGVCANLYSTGMDSLRAMLAIALTTVAAR